MVQLVCNFCYALRKTLGVTFPRLVGEGPPNREEGGSPLCWARGWLLTMWSFVTRGWIDGHQRGHQRGRQEGKGSHVLWGKAAFPWRSLPLARTLAGVWVQPRLHGMETPLGVTWEASSRNGIWHQLAGHRYFCKGLSLILQKDFVFSRAALGEFPAA